MQVQSVDAYKGTMTGCCVASHDRSIAVYSANVVPGEVAKPKAVWPAHGRTITVLHANRFCASLLSGDDGGAIRMYVACHTFHPACALSEAGPVSLLSHAASTAFQKAATAAAALKTIGRCLNCMYCVQHGTTQPLITQYLLFWPAV